MQLGDILMTLLPSKFGILITPKRIGGQRDFFQTALVLLTNFNIILALISAGLLTSKLPLEFHYIYSIFVSLFRVIKGLLLLC